MAVMLNLKEQIIMSIYKEALSRILVWRWGFAKTWGCIFFIARRHALCVTKTTFVVENKAIFDEINRIKSGSSDFWQKQSIFLKNSSYFLSWSNFFEWMKQFFWKKQAIFEKFKWIFLIKSFLKNASEILQSSS